VQNIRTLYTVTLQKCHSERSEESVFETLRFTQGDTRVCQSRGVWFSQFFAYDNFVKILSNQSNSSSDKREAGVRIAGATPDAVQPGTHRSGSSAPESASARTHQPYTS